MDRLAGWPWRASRLRVRRATRRLLLPARPVGMKATPGDRRWALGCGAPCAWELGEPGVRGVARAPWRSAWSRTHLLGNPSRLWSQPRNCSRSLPTWSPDMSGSTGADGCYSVLLLRVSYGAFGSLADEQRRPLETSSQLHLPGVLLRPDRDCWMAMGARPWRITRGLHSVSFLTDTTPTGCLLGQINRASVVAWRWARDGSS